MADKLYVVKRVSYMENILLVSFHEKRVLHLLKIVQHPSLEWK